MSSIHVFFYHFILCFKLLLISIIISTIITELSTRTFPLWLQLIVLGGSGVCLTIHVKLIVDPAYMNKSGPPNISVSGSRKKKNTSVLN